MPQPPDPADEKPKTEGLAFDEHGPSLDGVRLTRRTRRGWQPTEREILERELLNFAGLVVPALVTRLDAVCRAMDMGDFAKAAIVAEHVTRDMKRRRDKQERDKQQRAAMAKASPDDPKHPGWPAQTPGGKGGQFRPKDASSLESVDARVKRLAARRGFRSILRRILTFKRVARLVGEMLGDGVPGLDAASDVASLIDAMKLRAEAVADGVDTEAAIAFAEKGPQAVEDLRVSQQAEGFPSYDAFKKVEPEKRFGPAGDGYEYHHIVEQGPNASTLSAQDLNSTENIIRIPRLTHEDISSFYAQRDAIDGLDMPLRDFLRGKPFAVQREWGLRTLQRLGVTR